MESHNPAMFQTTNQPEILYLFEMVILWVFIEVHRNPSPSYGPSWTISAAEWLL